MGVSPLVEEVLPDFGAVRMPGAECRLRLLLGWPHPV